MAANAAPAAIPTAVVPNARTAEAFVQVLANTSITQSTSGFINWEAVPAGGAVAPARVQIPHSQMLLVFGRRCSFQTNPVPATRYPDFLRLGLTEGAWSRIITELALCGLFSQSYTS